MTEPIVHFGPFRLDLQRRRLLHLGEDVRLRPKVWDALAYLAQRPGLLVSSRELVDQLWPDVAVTPNALTQVISELRQALGGKGVADRYLRTVPKRGFLFHLDNAAAPLSSPPPEPNATVGLIGRADEMDLLRAGWSRAVGGQRQVFFVSGVPGVGKSMLVDTAAAVLTEGEPAPMVAKGQCLLLQQHGEPYLPLLEIFERLLEGIGAEPFRELARHYAPAWLVQMPWLLDADELADLRRTLIASGSERVLHEAVQLIERMSERVPLLLIVEDMQWADGGTLDLIVALSERSTRCRLMVIATYRAIEVSLTGHPLAAAARSLCSRRKAVAVPIDAWSIGGVAAYLDQRFGNPAISAALAERIERQTHGNPLFVQETADHLVRSGYLEQSDGRWQQRAQGEPAAQSLPESFRLVVESWLESQPLPLIEALEVASLIEGAFTVQEIAAALKRSEVELDDALADVARRSRLIEAVGSGRWPDGTATHTYRFSHALYRRVLSDRAAPLRQRGWHLGIAERLARGFAGELGKVANRLATHCDAAGDDHGSSTYHEIAAATAGGRLAYAEASAHLRSAMGALERHPPTAERDRRIANRWLDLGMLHHLSGGLGSADARAGLERGLALAEQLGDQRLRFRFLVGLSSNFGFGGKLERAMAIHRQMIELAEAHHPGLLPLAQLYTSMTLTSLGRFDEALALCQRARMLDADPAMPEGWSLAVGFRAQTAVCHGLLGRLATLEADIDDLLRESQQSRLRSDRMIALTYAAAVYICVGRMSDATELCARALAIADETANPTYQTLARVFSARVTSTDARSLIDALEQQCGLRDGLGERWWGSWFSGWLAEAYASVGDHATALSKTDAALAMEENVFRSETWRVRGTILAGQGDETRAEHCFRTAWQLAREQRATLFGLRSAVALAPLLRRSGRGEDARALLQQACDAAQEARGSIDFDAALRALGS